MKTDLTKEGKEALTVNHVDAMRKLVHDFENPKSNVIEFEAVKSERDPHKSGEARCVSCGYKWIAVAPIGTTWLECPKCSAEKGLFVFPCVRFDIEHWTCNCGNDLFHIARKGMYCPNCGEWQNF